MANGLPIDIDTFRKLPSPDDKLDALFDVLLHMHGAGYECGTDREARLMKCEERFKIIESRKLIDKGVAGAMGLIGGFIAGLTKKLFWE